MPANVNVMSVAFAVPWCVSICRPSCKSGQDCHGSCTRWNIPEKGLHNASHINDTHLTMHAHTLHAHSHMHDTPTQVHMHAHTSTG